jgi:hypothetical protein
MLAAMTRALPIVLAALLVGGCGGRAERKLAADPWASLHRPLRLPSVVRGARCPVSPAAPRARFRVYGVGRGLGGGPVYPIMPRALEIEFPPPGLSEFTVGGWGGQRVLWFVLPRYRGPVLVRGRRLDGRDPVRFDGGRVPQIELRIPVGVGSFWPARVLRDDGQRYRRSYTRLRAPGCYAFQVDGTSFSYRIVFRGVLGPGSAPLTAPS